MYTIIMYTNKGQVIVNIGEMPKQMFIIKEGQLKVEKFRKFYNLEKKYNKTNSTEFGKI